MIQFIETLKLCVESIFSTDAAFRLTVVTPLSR
jgi:hypothetical protein